MEFLLQYIHFCIKSRQIFYIFKHNLAKRTDYLTVPYDWKAGGNHTMSLDLLQGSDFRLPRLEHLMHSCIFNDIRNILSNHVFFISSQEFYISVTNFLYNP